MNVSVYVFGEFAQGYTQYPDDYSRSIFKTFNDKCKAKTQIAIHRDGDLMYYGYIRKLDSDSRNGGEYIGLCAVVNGQLLKNVSALFSIFEKTIENMVRNGYLIRFNDNGDIVANALKLYENEEETSLISAALANAFNSMEASAVKLPPVSCANSNDSAKSFYVHDDASKIVESSYTNSYTLVYKSKNYDTLNVQNFSGIIMRYRDDTAALKAKCEELEREEIRLRRRQRNTTWVSILGALTLIFGMVVWNKVLFPSEVTKKDMGEYVYYGPIKDGQPNGTGVAIYNANDKDKRLYYYGNFTNGKRIDEHAIMFYKDGSYFYGDMDEDQWKKGIFFDVPNKEHFEGEFEDNQPSYGTWYDHRPVQSIP